MLNSADLAQTKDTSYDKKNNTEEKNGGVNFSSILLGFEHKYSLVWWDFFYHYTEGLAAVINRTNCVTHLCKTLVLV